VGFGLVLPAYALLGTLRGEVQGQQNFRRLGINLGLEVVVKVALTPLALLVLPGISGAILATLAAIPTSLVQVWHRTKSKLVSKAKRLEVRLYALPVFTHLSAQAIIINSDVLMVNALLPAREAGIYAAVALIGRAIFYGSWAVGAAVFPMVTARHKAGQNHHQLLYLALIAVGLFSLSATAFCSLFPELVITLLFGSSFSKGAALVAPYALMTSLYTLANVISNHYLALGNHRAGYLSLVGVILQITLILSNHDTSLEVIWGQMWAKGILLGLLAACAGFGWFSKGEKHVLQGV
jgi:O-antigen/teichoic acid export membrane protein